MLDFSATFFTSAHESWLFCSSGIHMPIAALAAFARIAPCSQYLFASPAVFANSWKK